MTEIVPWRILESSYAVQSPYYRLRVDTVGLPGGTVEREYYVREVRGWVTVFCLTTEGEVVLNRQYKHGAQQIVLELPAGTVDDNGETPEEAIRRELAEETGYVADQFEQIGHAYADPTSSTAEVWIFLATGGRLGGIRKYDPREVIEVLLLRPEVVLQKLRSGEIQSAGQIGALFLGLDRIGLLGKE